MDPMDSAYSKLAREFQETEFPAIELMEAKFTWNYITTVPLKKGDLILSEVN